MKKNNNHKIVNGSLIRRLCHEQNVKISPEAIDLLGEQVWKIVMDEILHAKEMKKRVIYKDMIACEVE